MWIERLQASLLAGCGKASGFLENANQKQRRSTRLKQDQVALMNTATDVKTKFWARGISKRC